MDDQRTEILADHAQQLTITQPDGTSSTMTAHEDGRRESVAADGTTTALIVSGDPRFGLHAPVATSLTVTTPGGRILTAQSERWAQFGTPSDFSTFQQWDDTTINGRLFATYFNGATRTFTTTTPAGRTTTSTIDLQGRVTSTQVGNLTPVTFTYDAQS